MQVSAIGTISIQFKSVVAATQAGIKAVGRDVTIGVHHVVSRTPADGKQDPRRGVGCGV